MFNDTAPSRHYGCALVMRELARGLSANGMEPVWLHPVGVDWRASSNSIPRPPQIDAVVVNGEGSIHHPATRPRAIYLSELGPFARDVLNVPCVLINATIHAIDQTAADNLGAFDYICVRESASKSELANVGIDAVVVPDLTLGAAFPQASSRSGICGTDSVLKDTTDAIAELCERNGWPVRPMKYRPGEGERPESYVASLASSELVVTGRFHAVTMCLATRTPFAAIESNTPKISSFVRDVFGSNRRLITSDDLNHFEPAEYLHWTPEEAACLDELPLEAQGKIAEMFAAIRRVLQPTIQMA